jgi:hypothetical protein
MAGSKPRTERGKVSFTVKEFADGTPWIMTEQDHKSMPALENAFIAFELNDHTTLEQAQRIADFMNKNLATVSMTIFDDHPLYNQKRPSPTKK